MNIWTTSFLLLCTLPKLVIEHTVLLAPVLHLKDGVDTSCFSLCDGGPGQRVSAASEHSRLNLVKLLASNIGLLDWQVGRWLLRAGPLS